MFDECAPIWRFLRALQAVEDPVGARTATSGLHLMKVFPALALPSLADEFFGRKAGPRYNPGRRGTFRIEHWHRVVAVVADKASRLGCEEVVAWLTGPARTERPSKADQDRLDSVLCMLIGVHWRLGDPRASMMIGDLTTGYIVTPVSPGTRERLELSARTRNVHVT